MDFSTFRPGKPGLLFGQEHLQQQLCKWQKDPTQIPRSLLIKGPYGCGKTSIARMLASSLVNVASDLREINAAESRGIDEVRDIGNSAKFSPFGKNKVYILDETVHMTQIALSALQKIIEDPPSNVYFFLCTTEPMKLKSEIRSRCVHIEVKLLTKESTIDMLRLVGGDTLSYPMMEAIYFRSGGHARDAIKAAQIAATQHIQDVSQLRQFIGLSPYDVKNELLRVLNGDLSNMEEFGQIEDGLLVNILNQVIDGEYYEKYKNHYYSILMLRSQVRQHMVSGYEYLKYILSITSS